MESEDHPSAAEDGVWDMGLGEEEGDGGCIGAWGQQGGELVYVGRGGIVQVWGMGIMGICKKWRIRRHIGGGLGFLVVGKRAWELEGLDELTALLGARNSSNMIYDVTDDTNPPKPLQLV